jgi:hypothetical protein
LRAQDGSESVVDQGSLAYKAGGVTELVLGLATGFTAGKAGLAGFKIAGKRSIPQVVKAVAAFDIFEHAKTFGSGIRAGAARGHIAEEFVRGISGGVKKSFKTPDGYRHIDNLWADGKIAEEVKTGLIKPSAFIRKQVQKDIYLLRSGAVEEVNWVFMESSHTGPKGPSESLAKLLRDAGINIIYK